MKTLKKLSVLIALMMLPGLVLPVQAGKQKAPLVQMAILLDTSGSMEGLIEQAKSQLWKVVNEFIASKKEGMRPEIQVALFEYGKDSIPAKEGYIRMIVSLTTDLDKVSEELFALRTNGGSEYCGQVIQSAVRGLQWSKSARDLKVIFIAGNEPFTQGPVDYKLACKEAISRGILVNTIHCGSDADGISGKWKDGALLADGSFMNINHNRKVEHIAAPQDKEINRLGGELNDTYIAYGTRGRASKARQAEQDSNASSVAAGSMTQRAVFKSSANYSSANAGWDLVEAEKQGSVKIEDVKVEDLPENMRKMSPKERKAYVLKQKARREAIQIKIQKLNDERKAFVAKKRKEQAVGGEDTLDQVMIKSIRKQAGKKQFQFGK